MSEFAASELFSVSGRMGVVTGGGGGLGRVCCRVLAANGADVAVVDVRRAAAEETAALIAGEGGRVQVFATDVSDVGGVERLASDVGTIHILVNNAGVSSPSAVVHEIPVDEWDRLIEVNLRSAFLCARAFIPAMLETGGSIINISSVVGIVGLDPRILSQAHYAASKAGLIGLTKQLAADYGAAGIRTNAIAPGWHLGTDIGPLAGSVPTAEEAAALEEELGARTPLSRTGTPGEMAGLMLYLASDASSFVTGQVFIQDGGWTVW